MYRLKTEHSFDAAHFLANYQGKCHNIHGHHWRVVLEAEGAELNSDTQQDGMLVDFGILKQDLRSVVNEFDHTLIVESGSLSPALCELLRREDFSVTEVPFRPTAERFARYIFDRMTACGYSVYRCMVYETETNCAEYLREGGEGV